MVNDIGAVRGDTCLLVEQVKTRCPVSVDLCDLGFDVAMIEWPTHVLKQLNRLTKVLDSLLIGLFAELIVTLLLKGSELFLKLCKVCVAIGGWCGLMLLGHSLFHLLGCSGRCLSRFS